MTQFEQQTNELEEFVIDNPEYNDPKLHSSSEFRDQFQKWKKWKHEEQKTCRWEDDEFEFLFDGDKENK